MDESIKGFNIEKKILTEALVSNPSNSSFDIRSRLREIDEAIKVLLVSKLADMEKMQ